MAMSMVVMLDIFSGRPNPRWTISLAQEMEFGRLVAAAPLDAITAQPEPLGYRGFVVTLDAETEQARTITVGLGRIVEGAVTHRDDGRLTERWLLTSGTGHLDPTIKAMVSNAIEGR